MAVKPSLFSKLKDSNQKFITRYHATPLERVPDIIKNGGLHTSEDDLAWTSALRDGSTKNSFYGDMRNSLVKFRVPKSWYSEHSVPNPWYREDSPTGIRTGQPFNSDNMLRYRKHFGVRDGGRVDTFNEAIPAEYIDEVCMDLNRSGMPTNCYPVDKLDKIIGRDKYDKYNTFVNPESGEELGYDYDFLKFLGNGSKK